MKKVVALIIAAAMLSAGVYAEAAEEEVFEVVSAASDTAVPEAEQNAVEIGEDGIYSGAVVPPIWWGSPMQGDIEKYLAENGCPDYVSFIFHAGASVSGYDPSSGEEYQPKETYIWEVGVVNATTEQKAEIEAIINDLCSTVENTVTFVECTYSYAEREAMLPEVRETVEKLFPEVKTEVRLALNTEQILVVAESLTGEQEKALGKELWSAYGDMVLLTIQSVGADVGIPADGVYGGAIPEIGAGAGTENAIGEIAPEGGADADGDAAAGIGGEIAAVAPSTEQSADNTILWVCIAAALAIALTAAVIVCRVKLIPVFATSNGDVTVNKKRAEEAVKNSEVVPDDSLLQAIKEKIEK